MKKMWFFWVLASMITIATAYYQRVTGPTYPKGFDAQLNSIEHSFKLPRSHPGETDCEIKLDDLAKNVTKVELSYKRYPTSEEWTKVEYVPAGDSLRLYLPHQPPAGKLQYFLYIFDNNGSVDIAADEPVIIRFRGDVPAYVIIPHVLLIFAAMLISNLTGLLVIGKKPKYRFYTNLTLIVLLVGGMIFGPLMQKYAFGEFWTGVPFGWDLTDNKTLIAFVGWIIAVLLNWKKERPWASLAAAILLIIVYSIPHSLMGSELDVTTGQVMTGG